MSNLHDKYEYKLCVCYIVEMICGLAYLVVVVGVVSQLSAHLLCLNLKRAMKWNIQ